MASTHGGSLGREKENIAPEKNSCGWLSTRIVRLTYIRIHILYYNREAKRFKEINKAMSGQKRSRYIAILKYFSNDFIVNSIGSTCNNF